jgi:hypothetical protein
VIDEIQTVTADSVLNSIGTHTVSQTTLDMDSGQPATPNGIGIKQVRSGMRVIFSARLVGKIFSASFTETDL